MIKKKYQWERLNKLWVDVDIRVENSAKRDEIVIYIDYILNKAGCPKQIKLKWLLKMIGIIKSKYYTWKERSGKANSHNYNLPKSNWLLPFEKEAIINYAKNHYAENDYFLRDDIIVQ